MQSASETRFAHPAEQELARLFDEHGIDWLYEPQAFVLERDPDGAVRQAFTPDFYLPDLDLYIECTVMSQMLTARKRENMGKTRERSKRASPWRFSTAGTSNGSAAGRWTGRLQRSAGSTSAGV